eukprot:TRINITY_DN31543_c0_g1_i1.p1 TRINITY_DN31543_c0_g1~~TRINITY_DN31543_c0_g1_i1.p1  ORF type:complete len:511 (-),score=124.13 TRINITY_DN31543_c0_g1_i1:51-1583(-)
MDDQPHRAGYLQGSTKDAAEPSEGYEKRPSMLELMAQMRSQLQEQAKLTEDLERRVNSKVTQLQQVREDVERKRASVLEEQEHVAEARAELEEKRGDQQKAQAEIAASFLTKPARLRFGADIDGDESLTDSSAALVSTVRDAPPAALKSFILYHLHLGFGAIFLYFDDPDDGGIEIARGCCEREGLHKVFVQPVDEVARAEWKTCSLWPDLMDTVEVNNMSRQQLNCELAARKAEEMGLAWILHIDVDELLDLPLAVEKCCPIGKSPVARHFGAIPPEVTYLAYLNHEAVPEKAGEMEDYFTEVSLFRRNPHSLPGAFASSTGLLDIDAVEKEASKTECRQPHLAGMKLWLDISKEWLGSPTYFQGYSNGKAAARIVPGLRPSGVHRWGEQPGSCQYFDPDVAQVLHYSNCGEEPFLGKHRLLLSCTSAYVSEMPLYREVVGALRRGDEQRARDVYRNVVVLSPRLAEDQLRSGTCFRSEPLERLRERLHLGPGWKLCDRNLTDLLNTLD